MCLLKRDLDVDVAVDLDVDASADCGRPGGKREEAPWG